MGAFIDGILKKRKAALLILIFVILAGILAYINVPKESTPDVKIPIVYVSVTQDGISPEDAENLLARPIEQEVKSIEGVKEMRATCFEGGANVILEFSAGFDSSKALQDVREKVDIAKADLPDDARQPTVHEINLSLFPILIVKLRGPVPKRTLYKLARDLSDEIEANVTSVLKAEVAGDREDLLEILIPPYELPHLKFNIGDLYGVFRNNNQVIAAGYIDTPQGRYNLKIPGLLETAEDIMNLPIAAEKDSVLTFGDIGDIRQSYKDVKTLAYDRVDLGVSEPTVAVEISKRTGENLIDTVAGVQKVAAEMQKSWPQTISVAFAQDESNRIRDMLKELQNSIIAAVILVIAVIIYSLGWKSSLLVGISVPGAFLLGIYIITSMGYTVNVVVLFSLIFSIGMLVDGAIIVVEYADRLISAGEKSISKAFTEASKRMFWPVVTSISTILVVFLPLLFWPGVVGQFMKYMPITLLAVLASSILMALIFIPAIAVGLKKYQPKHSIDEDEEVYATTGFRGWYLKKLEYGLDHPKRIIFGAVGVLFSVMMLYKIFGKGVEFFPNIEPNSAIFYIHSRGNLSITEKEHLVWNVEKVTLDIQELESVYTRVGTQSQSRGEQSAEDVIGSLTVEFIHWQKRRPADEILAEILDRCKNIKGVMVEVRKNKPGPPPVKPIQIELSALNPARIEPAVIKLRKHIESIDGIIGIEDSRSIPAIQWNIEVNKAQARKFGVDTASVGAVLKMLSTGTKIGTYRPFHLKDEVDVVVRFPKEYRSLDQLDNLLIPTRNGPVPAASFIEVTPRKKIGKIKRVDSRRVMTIKADVASGVLVADKIAEIRKYMAEKPFDHVSIRFKGEEKDRKESSTFLAKAFGIAIFLVFLILVIQFNSYFSAGLVLSAVVMSTIGVFVGLLIHNLAFGIVMGGIGVIALAGIIVSNNIILIDTFDLLYAKLLTSTKKPKRSEVRDLIVRTCSQRLRPVILTKLTTTLGLLPIMCGIEIDFLNFTISQGAPSTQWWTLLSTCIVYGALFASSLTLFVTPCALMWRVNKRTENGIYKNA